MIKQFRPMSACSLTEDDLDSLTYPCIAQPKIDGIRCVLKEGTCFSKQMKIIPNHHIRNTLREYWLYNDKPYMLDGELILRDISSNFQQIVSAIMTREGTPDFQYIVFDKAFELSDLTRDYEFRFTQPLNWNDIVIRCKENVLQAKENVLYFEDHELKLGGEGIIIRRLLKSPYKFGRSTLKEGYLLKLKRFEDAEAIVIGFEEKMGNDNDPEINELGLTKRSTSKENLYPLNTLGALKVRGINGQFKDVEFNVGSGFDNVTRNLIWFKRFQYMNKTITYKYQRIGSKDKPRQPIFKGFRED